MRRRLVVLSAGALILAGCASGGPGDATATSGPAAATAASVPVPVPTAASVSSSQVVTSTSAAGPVVSPSSSVAPSSASGPTGAVPATSADRPQSGAGIDDKEVADIQRQLDEIDQLLADLDGDLSKD